MCSVYEWFRAGRQALLHEKKPERLNEAGVSDFYAAVLSAWQLPRPTRGGTWEKPIFHNPLIPLRSVCSATLQ